MICLVFCLFIFYVFVSMVVLCFSHSLCVFCFVCCAMCHFEFVSNICFCCVDFPNSLLFSLYHVFLCVVVAVFVCLFLCFVDAHIYVVFVVVCLFVVCVVGCFWCL